MKKVLILLIFSFLTCFVTFAQNSSNSTVTLTAEQYNALPIMINLINSYKPHKTLIKKHFIKEKMQFEKEYRYDSGDGDSVAFCYGGLLVIITVACLIMFV